MDLLDAAFWHDQGRSDAGPDLAVRAAIGDYLGCHEEARVMVWEMWRWRLSGRGPISPAQVEYWLDAEFTAPCPE